jgi:hypothetical protein
MTDEEKHADIIAKLVVYFAAQPKERRDTILFLLKRVNQPPKQVTIDQVLAHIRKLNN